METAVIRTAVKRLREAGVENPEREAVRLLGLAFGLAPEAFWANRPPLTEPVRLRFEELVGRRADREPFAYLAGEQEFFGVRFKTPRGRVLIPRPETETLVETVLSTLPPAARTLVDVGTGSGAIAVNLKRERPEWVIWATDMSCCALVVAQENARRQGVSLTFRRAHLLEGLPRFDAIVANLPYVDPGGAPGRVSPETRFEPRQALYAGEGGLALITRLVAASPRHLKPSGTLFLEVGIGQATTVSKLLEAAGFRKVRAAADLSGTMRVVYGEA